MFKKLFLMAFVALLVAGCQKDETDKIMVQEQEKDLSQIIATNENGVSLTEKEYQEFEKEFQRENDEFNKEIKEDEIITRNYIKNGNRIDMENIPVPKPSLKVIKKREEIEKEVERILK